MAIFDQVLVAGEICLGSSSLVKKGVASERVQRSQR